MTGGTPAPEESSRLRPYDREPTSISQGQRPHAGMSVAFMVISAMGATVFFKANDWPVGLLFLGLFAVYFCDFFASIGIKLGERALGLFHLLTGVWLMYLAYGTAVDFSIGYHWRV